MEEWRFVKWESEKFLKNTDVLQMVHTMRKGEGKMLENLRLIGCGGCLYVAVELLYRGRSHASMFLAGGVCFWLIGLLDEVWPMAPMSVQMALGAWMIVCVEFLTGLIVNRWLKLGVWDYSGMRHNLMGQICLPFVACWTVLAGAAVLADDLLRLLLFGERFQLPVLF